MSSGGTSAPAGAGTSLSCRAVLGLILTKAIYLLQDTDRLGLHLQLVNTALETLSYIFNLSETQEFSELLHLCLFAFDKVCDFYKEQLYEEVLIQPVLDVLVQLVDLLNKVPQQMADSVSSERGEQSLAVRFKQPFTETFYRNTENVQRALRRALFRSHFSENSASYVTILTFFDLLESSEHID